MRSRWSRTGTPARGASNSASTCGLVELALAPPRGVQRHGHQGVHGRLAQARVFKAIGHPRAELMPQVEIPAILEAMDEIAHHAAGAIRRHDRAEMELAIATIRARKLARDRAWEWLRADLAKGRDEPARLPGAGVAQVTARGRLRAALRAMRGIEERQDRLSEAPQSRATVAFHALQEGMHDGGRLVLVTSGRGRRRRRRRGIRLPRGRRGCSRR